MKLTKTYFTWRPDGAGVHIGLRRKSLIARGEAVPVQDWIKFAPSRSLGAISRLLELADDETGDVRILDDFIIASHITIATLNKYHAEALGLPPKCEFQLRVFSDKFVSHSNYSIQASWQDSARRPVVVQRVGAILFSHGGTKAFRIPESLYKVIEEVNNFKPGIEMEEQWRAIAKLHTALFDKPVENLVISEEVARIRVRCASAFSLSITATKNSVEFDPVLFEDNMPQNSKSKDDNVVSEADGLYDVNSEKPFLLRLQSYEDIPCCVPVSDGNLIYLHPHLRKSLATVRKFQHASNSDRLSFLKNPRSILISESNGGLTQEDANNLFVETLQYSTRISDIGLWERPVFPWIKPDPESWMPERFGIRINSEYIEIKPSDISTLRAEVESALQNGIPTVKYQEKIIEVSLDTLNVLNSLIHLMRPTKTEESVKSLYCPVVLIVHENFETITFKEFRPQRIVPKAINYLDKIVTELKPHQVTGVEWLISCWACGYRGVLLADDMGLGKTLQTLVFLAWLRQARTELPILVVAPKGLLENWLIENKQHLMSSGIGRGLVAHGKNLKQMRARTISGASSDIQDLDLTELRNAHWVLTTYETLRDYHISFAAVPFSCAVFDEMQRVKNPAALVTHAAKTVNAEFSIGLTGTPVENRLEDIWSIMDILAPGFLRDMRNFSQTFSPRRKDSVLQLRRLLLEAPAGSKNPPRVLRRLKQELTIGLPQKHEHKFSTAMPPDQEDAYNSALLSSGDRNILELLHLIRGISLHPNVRTFTGMDSDDTFIQSSARLIGMFSALDRIKEKHEKAIVFIEDLNMQDVVAAIIQRRYKLRRKPLQINGQVTSERRQRAIVDFQQARGVFDVLILSPRVGGVGLTLHAANHVIHLSRWWNPAVEDQCNDRVYRIGQNLDVHVYIPMARHAEYGDSCFDFVLDRLLTRKRNLAKELMFMPPVNAAEDTAWIKEMLGSSPTNTANKGASGERGGQRSLAEDCDSTQYMPGLDSPDGAVTLDDIDRMEPLEFERWALDKFRKNGYAVSTTPFSGDFGADGICRHTKTGTEIIIQCKHTSQVNKAASSVAVKDLIRARKAYDRPHAGLLAVTNAHEFDNAAQTLAKSTGVVLITRERLVLWPWC